ncbi:hypothetical protein HMPREF0663_10484 [Hoylesella oralis ATCC 33269]|uniref:Uncharacterized protein n=1 Tax=Hoylesella oralis ATCC 33269 TaxID=873533 RepID=E7RMY4_9BACT|nr:hypothetical protein HMPREF0663_10484 [Hoylesella oralis ATCC 33269]
MNKRICFIQIRFKDNRLPVYLNQKACLTIIFGIPKYIALYRQK